MLKHSFIVSLSHASGLDEDVIIDIIKSVFECKAPNGTSRYSLNEVAADIVDGIGFLMEEKYPVPPSSEDRLTELVKSGLEATLIRWGL